MPSRKRIGEDVHHSLLLLPCRLHFFIWHSNQNKLYWTVYFFCFRPSSLKAQNKQGVGGEGNPNSSRIGSPLATRFQTVQYQDRSTRLALLLVLADQSWTLYSQSHLHDKSSRSQNVTLLSQQQVVTGT